MSRELRYTPARTSNSQIANLPLNLGGTFSVTTTTIVISLFLYDLGLRAYQVQESPVPTYLYQV